MFIIYVCSPQRNHKLVDAFAFDVNLLLVEITICVSVMVTLEQIASFNISRMSMVIKIIVILVTIINEFSNRIIADTRATITNPIVCTSSCYIGWCCSLPYWIGGFISAEILLKYNNTGTIAIGWLRHTGYMETKTITCLRTICMESYSKSTRF